MSYKCLHIYWGHCASDHPKHGQIIHVIPAMWHYILRYVEFDFWFSRSAGDYNAYTPTPHLPPSNNALQQGITARWPVCLQYCQTREKAMMIIRPESVCSIARRHLSFLVHPQVKALLFTHSGTMPHLPPFLSYSPSFSFFSLHFPLLSSFSDFT